MNNADITLAIKSGGLEQLTIDFLSIADNISIIFDKLDEKFNTLEEYLKCESMTDIKQKYNTLKANYSIIKENTISYSDDISILNKKMSEGEVYLTNIVNTGTENVNSKVDKEVNNTWL